MCVCVCVCVCVPVSVVFVGCHGQSLMFSAQDYSSQVSRIEYLAHIPLFMAVAPPVLLPPEEQAGQPGLADNQ